MSFLTTIKYLNFFEDTETGKSTALPQNVNIREAVCGPTVRPFRETFREINYDILEVCGFSYIEVFLEANTIIIPATQVHL
jgi:hypothetical protein